MKILLCAATQMELSATIEHFSLIKGAYIGVEKFEINYLITGAGILNTAFHLQQELISKKPDLVINAGIAGAIDKALQLAEVVRIKSESLGDFGAEDGNKFLRASEIGLENDDIFPFSKGIILASNKSELPALGKLKSCFGTTVQKVHGSSDSIEQLKQNFPHAQVESMEGAAVFYVCSMMNIPFEEIRSISNYVEKRNKATWQIESSVKSLNDFLIDLFSF